GVQVAQVQIIFKLPDHLGSYPHPLAYVERFTTLPAMQSHLQPVHASGKLQTV
ncbi:hypothetical protein PISMIDRAFT_111213, partial [Pisolithus microcarpus 441]